MRITVLYTVIFAALFAGFFVSAYHLFAGPLDKDATNEVNDRAQAIRGYLKFENDSPVLRSDEDLPENGRSIRDTTLFQIYDPVSGRTMMESSEMQSREISIVLREHESRVQNGFFDVTTDEGRFRFHNERVRSPAGHEYVLQVGISLKSMQDALNRFARLGLWLGPLALLLAATSGWFMASRALNPVRDIVHAAQKLDLSNLDHRLPVSGANDELDELAVTFNDAFARLAASVGEIKQLTASMAHELRTPLAALRGEAEIALLHEGSVDELKRVLSSQLEEIDKLTKLIDQLLMVTKAESGLLRLERKPVDIAALLRDLDETLAVLAAAKGISLTFDYDEDLVAKGDSQWLKHAVLNVVDNAIKYTPEGGWVAVRGRKAGDYVVIEVRDTGIGIPVNAIPHIFERFYRADSSRAKDIEGVGLGLNLAKWILDHHGGDIYVTSEVGKGSDFGLRVPTF
jgi:heavy metal sensor kinase